jgi:phage terminase large subunit-like protein
VLSDLIADRDDLLALGAASGIEGLGAAALRWWKCKWYGDVIGEALESSIRAALGRPGGVELGAISVPPGEGKTWRAACLAPARLFGLDPHAQVITSSHNRELAARNLKQTRDIMASPAYLAAYPTRTGSTADLEPERKRGDRRVRAEERSQFFRTLRQVGPGEAAETDGYYLSTSVSGGATGWRYHLGICDDTIKDAAHCTEAGLKKIQDWFGGVFLTRGHKDRNALALIGTRWHPDDVIGTEVKRWREEGLAHYHVELPALRDLDDGPEWDPRKVGEWLDAPSARNYEKVRKALPDPALWEALYQQRPMGEGRGILRRADFGRFDPQDLARWDIEQIFTSTDPAQKPTGRSRYAIGVWAAYRGRLHRLDRRVGHWDYDEFEREHRALAAAWPAATVHLMEDTAAGAIYLQRNRSRPDPLHGLIAAAHPVKDKASRTTAVLPHYRGGRVLLPSRTVGVVEDRWVEEYLCEVDRFPKAPNDEVDETTQAVQWAQDRGLIGRA